MTERSQPQCGCLRARPCPPPDARRLPDRAAPARDRPALPRAPRRNSTEGRGSSAGPCPSTIVAAPHGIPSATSPAPCLAIDDGASAIAGVLPTWTTSGVRPRPQGARRAEPRAPRDLRSSEESQAGTRRVRHLHRGAARSDHGSAPCCARPPREWRAPARGRESRRLPQQASRPRRSGSDVARDSMS